MDDKTKEMMRKLIEEKKQKSASQGNGQRAPERIGEAKAGNKKHKKGGLFDK